jgi:hypothetical protein
MATLVNADREAYRITPRQDDQEQHRFCAAERALQVREQGPGALVQTQRRAIATLGSGAARAGDHHMRS